MSSNTLTDAQIETFNVFAAEVESYLTKNSSATKTKHVRVADRATFLNVWKTVGKPSGLRRVMQTQKFFTEKGRTKKCFQKRDEQGNPLWKDEEKTKPVLTDSCCVMYTVDAYREMRREYTGLKSSETTFVLPWKDVPRDWQWKLAAYYFPRSQDFNKNPLPKFQPVAIGLVLRKGEKPSKGEKRHSWSGFDFIVSGLYSDEATPVVITQVAVANKPYLAKFAELIGATCPDWGQNDEQPKQEQEEESSPVQQDDLSVAACAIMANADYLL